MVLAVAAVGVVAGVAVQKSKNQNNMQQYEAKFAFIAPKKWSKIVGGVVEADRELGSLTKCILYTQDESSSQAEALRYALLSGADGIITGGMESSPDTEAVIQEAREKGVPVVYVDSDLEDSARSCYIGSDNYEVGRMAGEFLAKETGGRARVCVIVSYKNNANQRERICGFQDAVNGYPDIAIELTLEGRSSALILEKDLPRVLQEHPEIDGIVCAEGASSHHCGRILRENQISAADYCIVGMDYYSDLAEQVEDGTYAAIVWQDQFDMGYQAVRYLKDVVDGKERTEDILYTDLVLLTAENFKEYTAIRQTEEVQWHVF